MAAESEYQPVGLVRVIVSPSFRPQIDYAAFPAAAKRVMLVRRVMPEGTQDHPGSTAWEGAAAASDEPRADVVSDRAMIDEAEFRRVCAPLRTATIRVMPDNPSMGLDGTSFEVILGEWQTSARFRWWESVPEGWEPLDRFVRDFIELVDRWVGPRSSY